MAWLLSNLKGDHGGWEEMILTAARLLISPEKRSTLMEQHFSSLEVFRVDPSRGHVSLKGLFEKDDVLWKKKLEKFFLSSQQRYSKDCVKALEALMLGARCEVWAKRLAYCTEVEVMIDHACGTDVSPIEKPLENPMSPGTSEALSFAGACAQSWLQLSLPVLPWILAKLLWPSCSGSENDVNDVFVPLKGLRKALEHCTDSQALLQLRDAFVQACSLLLRAAWSEKEPRYAKAVSWFTSVLVVAHEACQILLPEIPAGAVAAAIAASGSLLSLEISEPPWHDVFPSQDSKASPVWSLEDLEVKRGRRVSEDLENLKDFEPNQLELSEAIAQEVHLQAQLMKEVTALQGRICKDCFFPFELHAM